MTNQVKRLSRCIWTFAKVETTSAFLIFTKSDTEDFWKTDGTENHAEGTVA